MMKGINQKLILGIFTTLLIGMAHAQPGDVNIIKDNRINALIKKQSEVVPPAVKTEIDGYRIQIFFDSDRDAVNGARGRFVSKFPKIDTYVRYVAPNSVLKVGDFRTQLEAERIKAQIEADFPTSFVVKEKINLPRLEKQEI
ncbi:MAG: hypothetical protein QNK23_00400 [Crocinitomicaceae bacterium]|nr:hypothetical protein [Crocinitomicaceae bacterium]